MSKQGSGSDPDPLDPLEPQLPNDKPPPGGNGNGGDEPPVRITRISPIAGALAGGITVTLTGTGFQPDAEVFFGSHPSPGVPVVSDTTARALLPAATETGSVSVTLVNPDSTTATRPGGFTYITTEQSGRAEVLGITPLAVIEDTETEVTIRGRNLITAYQDGLVALRGPSRAHLRISTPTSERDAATGIESLTFTVRITAMPPLGPLERMAIQVLASRRPGAQNDGVVESSQQMFTVLPRAIPVPLAYSANLVADKPNLVVVAGRNLEGCSLDLGEGATVHLQSSDDHTLVGIVSFPDGATKAAPSTRLSIRSDTGSEVAQYELSVAPSKDGSDK